MNSREFDNTPGEDRGDCFFAAFDLLSKMPNVNDSGLWLLVHGNVAKLPQDVEVNHAWVEHENIVYDYSNSIRTEVAKDNYYKQHEISSIRQYTIMEAFQLSMRDRHYGPWPN